MKKEDIYKELVSRKKILEDKGFKVLYIGLYGSQNYNVDDDLSDIDVKAIVLPTLDDIIARRVISTTYECENGAIDCKDLLTFYDVIKKGNFSYVEAIDTEYFIGDKYIKELLSVFRPNFKSILGAMHEKRKALSHEYPSKTFEFEKWGCDPKQYHHIIRLYDLLNYNITNNKTLSYLKYDNETSKVMINIKRNACDDSKEVMENASDYYIERAKELIPSDYVYNVINIDEEIRNYIKKYITLEICTTSNTTSAREVRTFDNQIPKSDLKKFPELEKYNGQDISYIVYESLEIL